MYPDDYYDNVATEADAEREYVWNVGAEREDVCWILSDRDVWYRNPHYNGPPVPHPEDYQPWEDEEFDI